MMYKKISTIPTEMELNPEESHKTVINCAQHVLTRRNKIYIYNNNGTCVSVIITNL